MSLYNIEVVEKSDGHWLIVTTEDGRHGSILIENMRHGPVVGTAFLAWAEEQVTRQEYDQWTDLDDLIEKLNRLIIDYKFHGEPRMLIQRAVRAIEHFQQLQIDFFKLEGLAQSGSDMEGHELALQMNMILHPELYDGNNITAMATDELEQRAKAVVKRIKALYETLRKVEHSVTENEQTLFDAGSCLAQILTRYTTKKCVWTWDTKAGIYKTTCGQVIKGRKYESDNFEFCPFKDCGGRIECC